MKKRLSLIILARLLVVPAFAQEPPTDKAASDPPVQQSQLLPIEHPSIDKNWKVVFEDDFNTFDRTRWGKKNNHVHGDYDPAEGKFNEEPQVYDSSNAYIKDGKLVLETIKMNENDSIKCPRPLHKCQYGGWHKYASGQVSSWARYKYGYYEIYAQLPGSDGYWPAFWFWHSSPDTETVDCWYNEIDVFEASGCDTSITTNTVWWDFGCPINLRNIGGLSQTSHYTAGYHWYGVEWNSSTIIWYVDRKPVRQVANNMGNIGIQHPMYIIMNVALVPTPSLYWLCQISASNSIFPNHMHVNQANAYRLKCHDCQTVVNEISNFDTFNYGVKKSITLSGASSIPQGKRIALRATDYIELKAGFEVPLGSELYLCPTPCSETTIE